MTCIFCFGEIADKRVEHILPESLGGKAWACLPHGIVCGSCNQYFGAKVEAKALSSYPFLPIRLLLGIPTKHRKPPAMSTAIGIFRSTLQAGLLGIQPLTKEVEDGIDRGEITQVRVIAQPQEPLSVCRLLLKMGIEVAAMERGRASLSLFESARRFARSPRHGDKWWFLIVCDFDSLFSKFRNGITETEWFNGVKLSIEQFSEAAVFHLRLLDMSLIVPLDERIQAAPELHLLAPHWQVIDVVVGEASR